MIIETQLHIQRQELHVKSYIIRITQIALNVHALINHVQNIFVTRLLKLEHYHFKIYYMQVCGSHKS
jgi:hypothetical protein